MMEGKIPATPTAEYIGSLGYEDILRRQIDRINWLFSIGRTEESLGAIEILRTGLHGLTPSLDEEDEEKLDGIFVETEDKIAEITQKIEEARVGPYGKLEYLDEEQKARIGTLEAKGNRIAVESSLKRLRVILEILAKRGLLLKEEKEAEIE